MSQRNSETDCAQIEISEKSTPPNVRNTHSSATNTVRRCRFPIWLSEAPTEVSYSASCLTARGDADRARQHARTVAPCARSGVERPHLGRVRCVARFSGGELVRFETPSSLFSQLQLEAHDSVGHVRFRACSHACWAPIETLRATSKGRGVPGTENICRFRSAARASRRGLSLDTWFAGFGGGGGGGGRGKRPADGGCSPASSSVGRGVDQGGVHVPAPRCSEGDREGGL
eukprot:COSAG02_NODE_855_length_16487_cov_19.113498_3_plen_230_part_00